MVVSHDHPSLYAHFFSIRRAGRTKRKAHGTLGSCAQQVVRTEAELMFLPGGQAKVSLSPSGCSRYSEVRRVTKPSHLLSCWRPCPQRDHTAAAPRIPGGQGKHVPIQPTRQPRKEVHLASQCGAQFVCLVGLLA